MFPSGGTLPPSDWPTGIDEMREDLFEKTSQLRERTTNLQVSL